MIMHGRACSCKFTTPSRCPEKYELHWNFEPLLDEETALLHCTALHLLRTNMSCKWDGKSLICMNRNFGALDAFGPRHLGALSS